ncbi:autotransporter domain-containing protein [Bradyrhizobium sp. LLZ17]|uniref:Autotransporter domain-containing protein n=1 Tax=Bradyrhizobium sp. LLZ17 TaxID=3239388 RepID=A0AB39XMT2_9BRAD
MTSSALALAWALPAAPARASDGTWLTSPASNDYGTASNWDGGFVPSGTATFGTSNTTSLSISNAGVSGWTFNAGASNYTFDVSGQLNMAGAGITVNSGSVTINYNGVNALGNFVGSSTAGAATINVNNGDLQFFDHSTAGNAALNVSGLGQILFLTSGPVTAGSIAGAGTYDLGGNQLTVGSNNLSTVLTGGIILNGSLVKIGTGTLTLAGGYQTMAGDVTINGGTLQLGSASIGASQAIRGAVTVGADGTFAVVNSDLAGTTSISNSGTVTFHNSRFGSSSASSASISNSGTLSFYDDGTAGTSTITNTGSGTVNFYDRSTAGSSTIATDPASGNRVTVSFNDSSTAGNASLTNNNTLAFNNSSTAGSAGITNNGIMNFRDSSTASSATITNNGGLIYFYGTSTAGSAAITNNTYGQLIFSDTSSAANANITSGYYGFVGFDNSSTAGSATININSNGGTLNFHGTSTAGSATITNAGNAIFYDTSTAGSATINNSGMLSFYGLSTAGNAVITNTNLTNFNQASTAGTAGITNNGVLSFGGSSTAASATITNNVATYFDGASTAGSAAITNTYNLVFSGTSTAGNAVITNNGGGIFNNSVGTTTFQGNSTAGNAQLINNDPSAVFDFSGSSGPNGDNKLSAGSIAGDGTFYLGANELTVGSNNLSTTVSGVIADGGYSGGAGGSLVKIGTGTLTLSGANTYTGGTTFAGGTVSVSSDANLGDLAGSLTFNGGTLQVTGTAFNATARTINLGAGGGTFDIADVTNDFVISQGVSGSTLTKSGAGTLTLTGAESFSGATVSAGTLAFSANATAGNAAITNAAQLVFATSATAGNATITNNNQLTFYGHSTAGNAIIINSSNVLFDGDSTPDNAQLTNVAPGAVINFYTPGLNSDGKISAGSIAGIGRFDLNGAALTVGSNNLSTTVTGVLTGDGILTGTSLIKVGAGTLTLAGINTYTGATIVDGGALGVSGSIAASSGVTVTSGAALGGGGTVGTTTVNAGGTLAAGNGAANSSLNVVGSLALQSGAYYMVQINPATSSFANVTGTATLGGSTLKAVYANGSYVAKQYAILTAGSVSGTFGSVVETNLPSNFSRTLSYDATHAYLNLILDFVAPPGSGLSGNQQKVGNAIINSFNANGGISLVYSGLTAAGLTQASGETAVGSQGTTFQAMGQFMGLLTDPSGAGRDTGGSVAPAYADSAPAGAARDAFAMLAKAPPTRTFEQRWSVWASGFAGSQTTDGNTAQGSNSATSRLFGTAAGAEYAFSPQTLAGFALAGGGTSFSVTGGGSGRSDLFQAGAYVHHTNGPSYISAALAYGRQDVTTDRTVTLAGVDRLRAEFNANAWSGRLESGYRFVSSWIGGIGLTPYAAGQFTTFNLPAYAETVVSGSNAFALAYAAKSVTDTRSELGLRADKSFAMQNGVLTLRGRAAWAHDFNPDHSVAATFQALPGASFVVSGARPAADSALTTVSAEMKWLNGWSASASFEGEFSNVTRSYAGKGTVRYAW